MFDTIAAIATPLGEGGIAIIRVSGSEAIPIVDKIYRGKQKLSTVDSHTIHYGHIVDQAGDVVDEVMVSVMKSPRTFTREDVVEVNCHGGLVIVQRVLEIILNAGARLAEPGEFTKRAFLNGRIDLSQAEAVIDLIRAKTERAMKVAMGQVQGKLSATIGNIRNELLQLMAHIEVNIDYPEHDVEEVTRSLIMEKGDWVKQQISFLLRNARQGKIMREGLSTAIIGRPNVGKSSLLNTLLQESKAIVTDIPGTTRDIIEEYVNVRGIPLRLIDTAGIRNTEDVVEKIGVEKSREILDQADLILLLLNNAEPLSEEDIQLIDKIKNKNAIIVVNKMDLPSKLDMARLEDMVQGFPLVTMSIKNEKGIDHLEEAIAQLFFAGQLQSDDLTYVSNARHIQLLKEAQHSIDEAREACEMGLPVDMIAFDLRRCWELLGEITGETVSEDLLDQIFSRFCLGK
jgi:tRNA modification GTPase